MQRNSGPSMQDPSPVTALRGSFVAARRRAGEARSYPEGLLPVPLGAAEPGGGPRPRVPGCKPPQYGPLA